MSKVNVIMAAYNVRPYVAAAVRSILDQSLQDLRIIVVDDGSADGTAGVLSSIRDPRLRVIRTENMGVCHARNRALQDVNAPYVAIMDADDLCHPDRIARQVGCLDQTPDLVGVGCSVWLMTPKGQRVYEDRCPTGTELVLSELYGVGGGIYPQTCVMRTESLRRIGGYRPAIPVSEDLDLLLRLSAFGGLDNVAEALYSYRLNPCGLTFSSKARRDYYANIVLQLCAERRATGTDRLELGVSIPPFVPRDECHAGDLYTIRQVLAHFYRQAALELLSRSKRVEAAGQLLKSLMHRPLEWKTWKLFDRLLFEKREPLC